MAADSFCQVLKACDRELAMGGAEATLPVEPISLRNDWISPLAIEALNPDTKGPAGLVATRH
jgi:hypothetical protein